MKSLAPMFAVCAMLVAGCSTTSNVTNSYVSNEALDRPLNKMLVFAMMNDQNRATRHAIEQQFAADLQMRGYQVESSYDEYGPHAFKGLSEEQALQKMKKGNIDGVITVTLLDRDQEKQYVPGRAAMGGPFVGGPFMGGPFVGGPFMGGRFWNYYNWYYPRMYQPGYYTTNTTYFIETNVYAGSDSHLVYSAQSKTFDPGSIDGLASSVSRAVIKDMQAKGIIRR